MKESKDNVIKHLRKKEKIHWKTPFDEDESVKYIKDGLKEIEWDKSFGEYWKGINEILQCEKADRAFKRAKKLEIPEIAEDQEILEEEYHAKSIEHFNNSRKFLKDSDKKLDKKKREKFNEFTKDKENFKKFRTEFSKVTKTYLSASDLEPETSVELIKIVEEELDILEKEGYEGYVKHLDKKMDELIQIRSDKAKNRGREHRSPLRWWKWFIIGGIVAAIVGIMIGAFYLGWDTLFGIIMDLVSKIIGLINAGVGDILAAANNILGAALGWDPRAALLGAAFDCAWKSLIATVASGC